MLTEHERRRALWALAESGPLSETQYRRHRAAIEAGTVTYKHIAAKARVHLTPVWAMSRGEGTRSTRTALEAQLLARLRSRAMTARQLALDVGRSVGVVYWGLARLQRVGAVQADGVRGEIGSRPARVYVAAKKVDDAA